MLRQEKPGKGERYEWIVAETFYGTLRVIKPVRQSLASSRKRVLPVPE
jgi:hypothetical protein